ncbi:heme-binding protein 1-like [Macrobrachium rosenbergii]|uniref:heme-binding protein 1-like n=1 Tax=Macrobrachium rosenbergii TaxID=79674 RepID=UPI0010B8B241
MKGVEVLVTLLLVTGARAGVWDNIVAGFNSAFGNTEEAPYTLIKTTENYVERLYPAKKWVCTTATGPTKEEAEETSMFMKLFRYISGQNERSESIPMTVPVTTEYTHGDSGTNTYTMCFFIGEDHQADPPKPEDETVFIEDRPALTIYTRTVGGYMRTESRWMDEAARLAGFLQDEGTSVSLNHMYWVGYDAPFKFWNRRNEVWFRAN